MKSCVIVDDEPLAIELLSSYVEQVDELKVTKTFSNPIEFLQYEKENKVDVIFLDINMPELSGIQVAKIVNPNSNIIFTTAYPNYAVEGFEIQALDYLVKPISFERFKKAIERLQDNKPNKAAISPTDAIFIKVEHRLQKVLLREILFLKGMGDYVQVVTENNKWMTLENLKSFEENLDARSFPRVHKSYIISLSKVDFIKKGKVSINERKIPIGKTYEKAFYDSIK